jgi:hypothetical protein
MTTKRSAPGPSRATHYGPEYEQLLLTAWNNAPFRFPMETEAGARAMRGKVYEYFRHLRAENLRLDLIEMADGITLSMDGATLLLLKNEQTWDHEAIRKILGVTKDSYGLRPAHGQELAQPDLLQGRLLKQLQKVRDRSAGKSQRIVMPAKDLDKNV